MSIMSDITPCIEDGCTNTVYRRSRCRVHYNSSAFGGGKRAEQLPSNWAQLRRFILQRDAGICYICGQEGADSVDHVIAGNDHRPSNLKAAHLNEPPYCHRLKTAEEGIAARRRQY